MPIHIAELMWSSGGDQGAGEDRTARAWVKSFISNIDIVYCAKSVAKGLKKGLKGDQDTEIRSIHVVSKAQEVLTLGFVLLSYSNHTKTC